MSTALLKERLMRRTEGILTSWTGIVATLLFLFLVAMALTGCAEPAAIAAVEPTPTIYPPSPTDIPLPPPGPTPAALEFPLPAPTHEELESQDGQSCVDCHTDEETLKAVATEVEQEESLSEGEG